MPSSVHARSLGFVVFGPFGAALAALLLCEVACTTETAPSTPQCTSNDQCAPMGLVCNLSSGQCTTATNPTAGAGGTPTTAGGGGAAGSPSGGMTVGGAPTSGAGGTLPLAGSPGSGGMSGASGASGSPSGGSPSGGSPSGGSPSGGSAGQPSAGRGGTSGGSAGSAGAAQAGTAGAPANGTCGTTWQNFPSYNGNGSVTFYDFGMGSNCPSSSPNPPTNKCVNCSYRVAATNPDRVEHVYTGEGRYFAAMNTEDYRAGAACGACVEVTRDGSRRVVATVVDQCPVGSNPVCKRGHIDLSREAFRVLGAENEGHLGTGNGGRYGSISWRYVPCPVPATQNVSVRLKEPNNEYYTAVNVRDHVFPVASVQIKGRNATRTADNFWIVGDGNVAPPPWFVRVTDVNGWMYDATLPLGSAPASTGRRATCQ